MRITLVITAYKPTRGKSSKDPDPRSVFDYFFDTNFIDTYDTLIAKMRAEKIDKMKKILENVDSNSGKLIHVTFDDLKETNPDIYRAVKSIGTSFKIGPNEANCLKHAGRILVESEMNKLKQSNLWSTLVQDPPSEAYQIESCLQEESNQ